MCSSDEMPENRMVFLWLDFNRIGDADTEYDWT